MKKILLENAYESWLDSTMYAKLLRDGVSTLGYKKHFVSSLHNAVELFVKQMMLDRCDYRVASVSREVSSNGEPLKSFYNATDLNEYFKYLNPSERKKFFTIEFSELIKICKGDPIFSSINCGVLTMLNNLRNNETHFYVSRDDYLSDSEFMILYNFMIDIFLILEDQNLMPWLFGRPIRHYDDFIFDEKKLVSFCFSSAIKKSKVSRAISENTYDKIFYHPEMMDAAELTGSLWQYIEGDMPSFERAVAYVDSLLLSDAITFKHITEQIPEELGYGEEYQGSYLKIKTIE